MTRIEDPQARVESDFGRDPARGELARELGHGKRVVVPARHAYSHSASVGKRQRKAPPRSSVSLLQNAVASCHVTNTTGWASSFSEWVKRPLLS